MSEGQDMTGNGHALRAVVQLALTAVLVWVGFELRAIRYELKSGRDDSARLERVLCEGQRELRLSIAAACGEGGST